MTVDDIEKALAPQNEVTQAEHVGKLNDGNTSEDPLCDKRIDAIDKGGNMEKQQKTEAPENTSKVDQLLEHKPDGYVEKLEQERAAAAEKNEPSHER